VFYSIKFNLIASFLGASLLVGAVSLFVGGHLLYEAVLSEATNRVRLDLNAAREMYLNRINCVEISLKMTTLGYGFRSVLTKYDSPELVNRLKRLAQHADLDFAGIVTEKGETLCRIGPNFSLKRKLPIENSIANLAIKRGTSVSGTVILSNEFLSIENPELASRATIRLVPTPKAGPRAGEEETSGMALAAAVPVFEGDVLLGVLYGGILLNRSQTIVDKVRDTVFRNEIYKGSNMGTVTIFFDDLRISTNVLTPDGERAIGTRVSEEVKEHVLIKGKQWTDRAFVVNDWYITAYEPIKDIFGERVGMLYVGVLEAKYADIRKKTLSILVLIIMGGVVLAIGLGLKLANRIMHPVHQLIGASRQVSESNLSPDIGPISNNEIGILQKTFAEMIASLRERNKKQMLDTENILLQSEKQASIGRLAAGIAHEINNPLVGVLTYTHMLLRRKDIGDEIRSDLKTVAESTERVRKIVKGLLDFSRQTTLDKELTGINRLVRFTISSMENQALVKGVKIEFNPGEDLPMLVLDPNQIQSVLLNLFINALDATEPGDSIILSTSLSASDTGTKGVEIVVADTGSGIPPENLEKLFDPFFTTKEIGQGTGLGLSVSFGIIQRHGGTIRVQSEVGRGSTFFIWLPIDAQVE